MSKKHRHRQRAQRDPSAVFAENGSRMTEQQLWQLLDNPTQTMRERKEEYQASMIDASDPSNRFMRYRTGLGGGGDAHLYWGRMWWLRETSRHMVDNDSFIGQCNMRLADNIVQDSGFRLTSQTGDKGLDTDIEALTQEWGSDPKQCDYFAERTWQQIQWQTQYQTQIDGETFLIPIDNGTLQAIECERCLTEGGDSETNFLGREFTDDGRIRAYQFTKKPLGPYRVQYVGPTNRYPKFDADGLLNVYHVYDSRRFTRHIGLPWITPAMVKTGMLDDLTFAMLVRAQSCSAHAAFIKQTKPTAGRPPLLGQRGAPQIQAAPDGSIQLAVTDALKYGSWQVMPDGYELDEFSPSVPNPEFFPHIRETMREISANLSLPVEMSLLDASQTNFSGWRGAMDTARMSFRRWQGLLAAQLHRPVHCFNVRRWAYQLGTVARKKLADGSIYKHKWTPPAWPYVNPKEDAEAGKVLIETGQQSPRGLASSRGENYDEILSETVEDRTAAVQAAIKQSDKIKEATGWRVDPMVILGWDLPANGGTIISPDAPPASAAPGGAPAPGTGEQDGDDQDETAQPEREAVTP